MKAIEILLGLTVVMLAASMAVTVLTHFFSGLANMRGKHLLRGLSDLLQQIDPGLQRQIAEHIARAVLVHPMISQIGQRPGSVIQREEFAKLLIDLAAGDWPASHKHPLADQTKQALASLMQKNGIADPAATMDKVRACALELELANPALASDMRHSMALIQQANSRLLGKINGWFDQTMDRVTDRFTAGTRFVNVVCSVVVVAALQLDTIDLVNRLAMEDHVRAALVEQAIGLNKAPQASNDQAAAAQPKTPALEDAVNAGLNKLLPVLGQPATTQPTNNSPAPATIPAVQPATPDSAALKKQLEQLQALGLVNLIGSNDWCEHWHQVNPAGLVLSVFLLSLGAPFWFEALKNLLRLRGALATRDDGQRQQRQTAQTGENAAPGAG